MTSRVSTLLRYCGVGLPEGAPSSEGVGVLNRAAGVFVVKVAGAGLNFFLGVVLARTLGVKDFGVYAYVMSWVGVLGVLAGLGSGELLVRETAINQRNQNWGRIRGFMRWARYSVSASSLVVAVAVVALAWVTHELVPPMAAAIIFAALLLPINGLVGINQSILIGLRRTVLALSPGMVLRPAVLLMLLAIAYFVVGASIGPGMAVALQVAAAALAFILGARSVTTAMGEAASIAEYECKAWYRAALPFLVIGLLYVINNRADILMLGLLRGPAAAGIYSAAVSGAEMMGFVLLVANTALAPTVAALYRGGEHGRLQRLVTRSARFVLLATVPLVVLLIVFGGQFLSIFGDAFVRGRAALTILCVAQFMNVAMGSVALLLNMTGHERWTVVGVGLAALLNIGFNALLIPRWGLIGAASATLISMVSWNFLLLIGVRKRLGIDPTAFGLSALKSRA